MANTIIVQRDTQLERQRAGFIALSLTNFTNDDEPTIAAGSVVEISGSLYSVTSNQSITGWGSISNGPVWVKLIPDGTNPFTAEYTATAPTWFDSKQGWYDGTGTDRYVAGLTKTGASGYSDKSILRAVQRGTNLFGNIFSTGLFPLQRYEVFRSNASWVTPINVYAARFIVTAGGAGGGGASGAGSGGGVSTVTDGAASIICRAPRGLGGLEESLGTTGLYPITAGNAPIGDIFIHGGHGAIGRNGAGTGGGSFLSGNGRPNLSITSASDGTTPPSESIGVGGGGSWNGSNQGGGGGHGGSSVITTVSTTPGESFSIVVGAGGAGGSGERTGGAGSAGAVIVVY